MKDTDIRTELRKLFNKKYIADPYTLIVEEMGICQGEARIDMAVINGSIHGYEIKSDQDTLDRLKAQSLIYNKSLDYVTLVVGSRHLDKATQAVPAWWGISQATKTRHSVKIKKVRNAKKNPQLDVNSIAMFLWRNEAIEILTELKLIKGYKSKSRAILCQYLASSLSIRHLQKVVHNKIRNREAWRIQPS